jgi:hypothetical protein
VRRVAVVAILAVAVAAAAATSAGGKGGVHATLIAPLPLDARAGDHVTISWRLEVMNGGAPQPFDVVGAFVRLYGAAGSTTTAFTWNDSHPDGVYSAKATVPDGGIQAIRIGIRGTTDASVPLTQDPLRDRPCTETDARETLAALARAFGRGDGPRVETMLAGPGRFAWLSSPAPGRRLGAEATRRWTVAPYVRARHARGDRLALVSVGFNGFDEGRDLGHFEFRARRRAADFRGGAWFDLVGKGALDCSARPTTIAVLSIGGPER